ncbi:MAG: alpha-2-macroglobulin family protein, partial [Sulfurimonas sp.]|nr:alpha-2-macroglobulin family protein [Sulfurimonas sp.]MDD3835567.1 alpha-2-macroglobulin family protein [Sulfurimonas sp.]
SSVWSQSNDATLEIVAQKATYKIGERAKYLVKNPFEITEALITVERYGVLDSWVETFTTSTPIVEFEVKEEYLPGFYLSVVALSPRVSKPIKDGVVDLGKPSYKMGYVQTQVRDAKKELEISVKSDKELYKPQEKVTLNIDVKNRENSKEYELAIAVVDASVLALNKKGDKYYDLYNGLNQLDSLDVQNFSLISRLIGRQNFEKKGANQGGDGGDIGLGLKNFRDDFKHIAYWNPSLVVKDNAKLEFTLPDNLTEYKVIVLGISKGDEMGRGVSSFKVNQEIQLRPIMPNQIVAGDSFEAGFSILNSSSEVAKLELSIEAKGVANAKKEMELVVGPFTREKIFLPLQTTQDGNITFEVIAKGKKDSDALKHILVVNKKTSLISMANFGSTTENEISEAIKVPKDIEPNVGAIGVTLSNTVLGNIDGAFKYLKDYPYLCWEQRLSKGVGASHYLGLSDYLSLSWQDADKDIKEVLKDASNYQAPNGGMAFWVGANEFVNPYISAYTALGFSWLKESGYEVDLGVKERLDEYLNAYLSQQDLTQGYNRGMSATIRAVALHALAREKRIKAHDIQRYFKHYKLMSLFGRAQYFQAMLNTQDVNSESKDELLSSILANATQSAGRFDFSESLEDESVYLLESPMRTNCAVLSALLQAKKVGTYDKKIGDIPQKLMRTITQHRGGRGHWENTQENLFCIQAIKEYAELYESKNSSMDVGVLLDAKELAKVEFKTKKDGQKNIEMKLREEDIASDKNLTIKKEGEGRLYYTSSISYSPKLLARDAINAGFEIHRQYALKDRDGWKLLTPPLKLKSGDVVRVDLYIYNASVKHFVVLSDPVAGGFEPINTTLATASRSDGDIKSAKMPQGSRWYEVAEWSEYGGYSSGFYHKELRHESAEFYADYLGVGNYHLSYTLQAIASGEFAALPSHIEQMYDADVFGESSPALFVIE